MVPILRSMLPDTLERRTRLVFGLIASCTSVLFVRILALAVPFRERPLRNPDLDFVLPGMLIGWTSSVGVRFQATTPPFFLALRHVYFLHLGFLE